MDAAPAPDDGFGWAVSALVVAGVAVSVSVVGAILMTLTLAEWFSHPVEGMFAFFAWILSTVIGIAGLVLGIVGLGVTLAISVPRTQRRIAVTLSASATALSIAVLACAVLLLTGG